MIERLTLSYAVEDSDGSVSTFTHVFETKDVLTLAETAEQLSKFLRHAGYDYVSGVEIVKDDGSRVVA